MFQLLMLNILLLPAAENGHQVQEPDAKPTETEEKPSEGTHQGDNVENPSAGNAEQSPIDNPEISNVREPSENNQTIDGQQSSGADSQQPAAGVPEQGGDLSSAQQQPLSDGQSMSRKMEVPNNKVS